MQKLRKDLFYLGIILFFVIYTGTVLILAKKTVLWEDEVYSLHTTSQNINYAIKQSYNFEGQPPFYFILLTIWRKISGSLFFARTLSLTFSLFSGIIIYKLSRIFLDNRLALISAILFLMNPAIVYFSLEARLYSFIIFLSLSSLYLFYKYYLCESPKRNIMYIHALVSMLGVFTQYFFVLLILAEALSLLLLVGWQKFLKYALIHLIVAVLFCINFLIIPNQVNAVRNDQFGFDLVYLKTFLRTLQNFIFSFNLINFNLILRRLIIIIYFFWLVILFKRVQFNVKSLIKTFNPVSFLVIITLLTYFSIVILICLFILSAFIATPLY